MPGLNLIARSFAITHNLDVRTTRCSNNYGPRQYPEKLIPVLIQRILRNQPLPIYGNGTNIREWIHVSDHCAAIELVLREGKQGEIYNIGTGHHLTNIEVAECLLSLAPDSSSRIDFVADRKGHDFRYSINSQKLKSLGFNPRVTFPEGIEETFKWYKFKN